MDELNFGSVDVAAMQREVKRVNEAGKANGKRSNDMFVQMPDGKGSITVRLLPPLKGQPLVCKTRIHTINGRNYHCPKTFNDSAERWDGDCPICEYYRWLYKEVDRLEKEVGDSVAAEKRRAEARRIKPNDRYYINVIVRQEIDSSGEIRENIGPKVLSVGIKLYSKILRAFTGDEDYNEPPLGDISDWKKGRDLLIIKEIQSDGSRKFPNYDRSKFLEPSPLGTPEEVAEWMKNVHDLSALRRITSFEELDRQLAIYRGVLEDETTGFNPDKHDKKYRSTSKTTVAVKETVVTDEVGETVASEETTPAPEFQVEGESIDIDKFYEELREMEE